MSPYNINVVKPEDEETYYNALQLQPAGFTFGNHDGPSSYPDNYLATSGRNGYEYPHISTSGFVNTSDPPRPQLTYLTTGSSQLPAEMQSNGATDPDNTRTRTDYTMNTSGFTHPYYQWFQASPIHHGWTLVDDHFVDPNSPSNLLSGSPLSQGYSPLTPNTPLSTVEPSPTVSSIPSPGSQGSNEVLHLTPSPAQSSSTLRALPEAFSHLQLANPYYHQHASETQLSVPLALTQPQSQSQMQQQPDEYAGDSGQLSVPARRHSQSALERPLHRISPSQFSPYPTPGALPVRGSSLRNLSFAEVPLIPRSEYEFKGWLLPGPIVPQKTYQPHTASDKRRYVDQVELQPPIYFKRVEPLDLGISLVDCMAQRFKRLEGYDDGLLADAGPSISIRLNWEGYDPWSRQIPTRNFKVPPGPISRKTLVKNIAKSVQRFIDEHLNREILEESNPSWQVGPGRIEFSDLVLLSMHHVSRGSWQVNLCLNQPLGQILNRSYVPQ